MLLYIFIVSVSITATVVMTLFSYLLSMLTGQKFEEPQLLNELIKTHPNLNLFPSKEHILGWSLHFIVGVLFVCLYVVLRHYGVFSTTILSGILFGALAGILGIVIWHVSLRLHPTPPSLNKTGFYLQLFVAHILFGVTMIYMFQFL